MMLSMHKILFVIFAACAASQDVRTEKREGSFKNDVQMVIYRFGQHLVTVFDPGFNETTRQFYCTSPKPVYEIISRSFVTSAGTKEGPLGSEPVYLLIDEPDAYAATHSELFGQSETFGEKGSLSECYQTPDMNEYKLADQGPIPEDGGIAFGKRVPGFQMQPGFYFNVEEQTLTYYLSKPQECPACPECEECKECPICPQTGQAQSYIWPFTALICGLLVACFAVLF